MEVNTLTSQRFNPSINLRFIPSTKHLFQIMLLFKPTSSFRFIEIRLSNTLILIIDQCQIGEYLHANSYTSSLGLSILARVFLTLPWLLRLRSGFLVPRLFHISVYGFVQSSLLGVSRVCGCSTEDKVHTVELDTNPPHAIITLREIFMRYIVWKKTR